MNGWIKHTSKWMNNQRIRMICNLTSWMEALLGWKRIGKEHQKVFFCDPLQEKDTHTNCQQLCMFTRKLPRDDNFPPFFSFIFSHFFFKLAIQLDKVNCKIYCLWSLLDNFEWIQGYNSRFGLFHVDFEDPARPRVPYTSAKEYAKLIQNNGLEDHP